MISVFLISIILILILPISILLIQVLAAIFSNKFISDVNKNDDERLSLAVLMPAHDEALVITKSIESILPQLQQNDRLLVIADNCSDDTAIIASRLDALVIERHNTHKRGKGFALDFGLQYLKTDPPDVVLVIDADCIVAEHAVNDLVMSCVHYQCPMQALYLMESQPNPSLKARIAQFAWIVKNKVRPNGMKALGLPCQLMGTGMAFIWADISRVNLASGHIVEDMKLGVDLARINKAAMFLPSALVTSVFPPTEAATITQRTRWEHGHLSVILHEVPSMILESIKEKNIQILGLACDLLIPPLAVLSLISLIVFLFSMFLAGNAGFLLAIAMLMLLLIAVLLAWVFFGRDVISLRQLCYAPIYVLIKIPLYFKFFLDRQVEWVRSKRD